MAVQNPPQGMTAVTPHIIVEGAAQAIEFYKKAFGAVERFRMPGPDGKIMHAQITIDGAAIMLCDAKPERGAVAPEPAKPQPQFIYLYIKDVDAMTKAAEAAGAKVLMPLQDQFYGDRTSFISDPFGHKWWLATHVEDVSEADLKSRSEALYAEQQKKAS
jgi:uncharacterized glyoxalase superfamily protein PhnB